MRFYFPLLNYFAYLIDHVKGFPFFVCLNFSLVERARLIADGFVGLHQLPRPYQREETSAESGHVHEDREVQP